MKNRDFLVTEEGQWQVCQPAREWDLLRTPYHFHRFLTEVEDVLEQETEDRQILPELRRIVRRLITNSYWIHTQHPPASETESSALVLYDEIGYPLTVQTASLQPGASSTIHNHGTWGVVAVLSGEEENTFWKRINDPQFQNRIEPVGELTLLPGDIISFTSDAVHCVKAVGDEPTLTFSIYGETHHSRRFEFNSVQHTAKNF